MAAPSPRVKPLHIALSALMLALMILFYAGLASITLYMGYKHDLETASGIVHRVGRELNAVFSSETLPIESAIGILADSPLARAGTQEARFGELPMLAAALNRNPSATSVYIGTAQGEFLMLRKLDTETDRKTFEAPEQSLFLVQSIRREQGKVVGSHHFYDAALKPILHRDKPDYQYDPRSRPWYQKAKDPSGAGKIIETPPYIFASNLKIGITLATRTQDQRGVIGMDVTLGALSRLIGKQEVTPSAELVLFNDAQQVLAYRDVKRIFRTNEAGKREVVTASELGSPPISEMIHRWKNAPAKASTVEENTQMQVNGEAWYYRVDKIRDAEGQSLYLGIAAPKSELMAHSIKIRNLTFIASLLFMALMLPIVYFASRSVSRPIRELVRLTGAIERFDFSAADPEASKITEVDDLSRGMTSMKHTLKRFLDISAALSAESNFHHLLTIILRETLSVAGAQSGSLVLVASDGQSAQLAARQSGSQVHDVSDAEPVRLDNPLATLDIQAIRSGERQNATLRRTNADDAARYGALFDDVGLDALYLLALPLRNRANEVIGAMTLSLPLPDDPDEPPISAALLAFIEALSGTAAVAMDNQKMVLDQKVLFENVIKVVAGAIDAKSAYSGGHCQRVPELTKMLARAACAQTEGPFADYALNDDEWEALHIAGWLHDCGKLTTPEFVVDKATKLETIYDRIHEVRMRFEVLKRDATIAAYEHAVQACTVDRNEITKTIAEAHAQLDEEFAFVATCNVGGEFMAPDKIERLKTIAQRRWLRTLDDRAGISEEERQRKAGVPPEPLPVWEDLLSDKPEHLFPRPEREKLLPDNPWGFKITPPTYLYNRGELYNLAIGRGTLTEEDRYKINEHIVQTIKMLTELPFPKALRRVPEIAGGHHEKLDGTGYPCRLRQEEMSLEARMMAIADVFEALTAVDRPYKKGKTLSEAIKIMGFMQKDKHIDPTLFALFLQAGVHQEYAQRFMRPEQIDTVDIAPYLK